MSEPKLISPMLDNFIMGEPISDHNGVRCCPAMKNDSDDRYIVKIISVPASQTQMEALLLSGAYSDTEAALCYFQTLSNNIVEEAQVLQKLSQLEGFLPFDSWQIAPMEEGVGYDVYLISDYKKTLQRHFQRNPMTHLGALNLGLDLCAALAVCRRLGYLYVNLKPSNVYLTEANEYRIGDLGFVKLDSLKYASLPDRYRSQYTAPEITDAYSSLNTTMDVYAVGLILYQAFNDGVLPFKHDERIAGELPPPNYADYEMSEIILKACAEKPEDRWQDPIEMGQALVSYMQRNGAHDTPIVPQTVQEEPTEEQAAGIYEETLEAETVNASENENVDTEQFSDETIDIENITEESIFSEDEEGNLTFIIDDADDETAPGAEEDLDYEEVTEEVSEILNQADDLILHPAPDPVVQPEPVDVNALPIPPVEEISDETETQESTENAPDEADAEDNTVEQSETEAAEDEAYDDTASVSDNDNDEVNSDDEQPAAKKNIVKRWILGIFISVIALGLLAAGLFYYKNYYLQPIESISLEESDRGILTVYVTTQIDESKLTVICLDTYGNPLSAPVVDGKAVFTGLAPNSAYTVKVEIDGFHRLIGDTFTAYTTLQETNIVQFQAVTGTEAGSVILGFTIEGPDSNQWTIRYSGADEGEKEISFTGHMITLSDLTVGTEYRFTLVPENELYIAGIDSITYTASEIIKAENLFITGCTDNVLTAAWTAPANATVDSWTVRCYNDNGYDNTVVVTETNAQFVGVDPADSYTVEVTASGMSVSERAFAPANSITLKDFKVDNSDPNKLVLSWDTDSEVAECDWILRYTMDGSSSREIACTAEKNAVIGTVVPGARYKISIQRTDGIPVLGGDMICNISEAQAFDDYSVSADHMEFSMCKTPTYSNWDRYDLSSSDYTTEFSVGQKASFLVRLKHEYDISSDTIVTLYVIRSSDGTIISADTASGTWSSLWYRNYGEFDIPVMPQSPGEYTISVYLNGAHANTQTFTVVE